MSDEHSTEYVAAEDGFGTDAPDAAIWSCKIGWADRSELPEGADFPLRQAVEIAFYELTGHDPQFTFSGWGDELTAAERAALNDGPLRSDVNGPDGAWCDYCTPRRLYHPTDHPDGSNEEGE